MAAVLISRRRLAVVIVMATAMVVLILGSRATRSEALSQTFWVYQPNPPILVETSATCLTDAPCTRIETAFQLAQEGDVIKLAGGPHPSQPIPLHAGSAPHVLIEPAEFTLQGTTEVISPVPVISGTLTVAAENVTLRGLQGGLVLFQSTAHGGVFEDGEMVNGAGQILIQAADNITVRNSKITGSGPRDPIQIGGGSGHVIEENVIGAAHLATGSEAHLDCLQIFSGSNIMIRRNRIFGCAAHALFIKSEASSNITNVTVENNFIQDCVSPSEACGAIFAIQINAVDAGGTSGVKFIHNTIDGKMLVRGGVVDAEWTGNIVDEFLALPTPADCRSFGTIRDNLIRTHNCTTDPPDPEIPPIPETNTIGTPTYVEAQTSPPNPDTGPDLRLDPGSAGVNAGSAATLADDIEGDIRTAPLDLGADETDVLPPTPATTCPPTMLFGDPGKGVAALNNDAGPGYLLWSADAVDDRFGVHRRHTDHLIAVAWDGTQWLVNNDTPFTPNADDCLLAELDSTTGTASLLTGTNTPINGIDATFATTDLIIAPIQWNGKSNKGEWGITGTNAAGSQ